MFLMVSYDGPQVSSYQLSLANYKLISQESSSLLQVKHHVVSFERSCCHCIRSRSYDRTECDGLGELPSLKLTTDRLAPSMRFATLAWVRCMQMRERCGLGGSLRYAILSDMSQGSRRLIAMPATDYVLGL